MEELGCPFCGFTADNHYLLMYHLESLHPEGDSPFIVKEEARSSRQPSVTEEAVRTFKDEMEFVECPRENCGETVSLADLECHLSMHDIEDNDEEEDASKDGHRVKRSKMGASEADPNFDTKLAPALRNLGGDDQTSSPPSSSSDRQASAKAVWRELLNMTGSRHDPLPSPSPKVKRSHKRLGKSELGPYAHEKQMPTWLKQLLEADGQPKTTVETSRKGKSSKVRTVENQVTGVIPVVEHLLEQDPTTEYAYTCHPCVQHVSKLQKEGGFCGYRNIQMMASYINGAESQGFHHFSGKMPTIFQIQDYIEHAWDLGINRQGRLETGGIRGTRKYIGTPEAQAMLVSLDIACDAQGLRGKGNVRADHLLFQYVEDYYSTGCMDSEAKVRRTTLSPLYFQHPGHSMTIIGIERKKDGPVNLLVFDPMFHDSSEVIKLIGHRLIPKNPTNMLRAYRRSTKYLRRYNEFEVLRLIPPEKVSQLAEE